MAHLGQEGREQRREMTGPSTKRWARRDRPGPGTESLSGCLGLEPSVILVCFCLDTDMVIIYLSAGITSKDSSEEDKKATLRIINEENSFLNNSVMILTYALMNGG